MAARTVVVLGMHRSGTSLVANALRAAGMYLGDEVLEAAWPQNVGGHGESAEAVRINDDVLRDSGGAWDRVPADVVVRPGPARDMAAFVERLAAHPVAGWKDPRTTVTFPAWRPHLGEHRIVACLRHPANVARSLRTREGWDVERGVALWAAYNERLLRHVAGYGPDDVHWFDFDAPADELAEDVRAVCRVVGLAADGGERFNPYLRHHVDPPPIADPAVRELYDALRHRAAVTRARLRAAGGNDAGRRAAWCDAPRRVPAPDAVSANLGRLADAHALQNAAMQSLGRWLGDVSLHLAATHRGWLAGAEANGRAMREEMAASVRAAGDRIAVSVRGVGDQLSLLSDRLNTLTQKLDEQAARRWTARLRRRWAAVKRSVSPCRRRFASLVRKLSLSGPRV